MYEMLLKWGLDTLKGNIQTESDNDFKVMLEAIKTKNIIIVERFKYAWQSCQEVVDISLEVENDLPGFCSDTRQTDGTVKGAKQFFGELWQSFHPLYYRKLHKIRSKFDASNELLSAYSKVFQQAINFEFIKMLVQHKNLLKGSDITRLYRGLWAFYAANLTTVLRITSTDLRFWITDVPYIKEAITFAQRDWGNAKQWLLATESISERFFMALESEEGLDVFWRLVESKGKKELTISG